MNEEEMPPPMQPYKPPHQEPAHPGSDLTFKPAIGSCWWNHQWSAWEPYTQKMMRTLNGQNYQSFDYRQRRICLRCGFMQDRVIN